MNPSHTWRVAGAPPVRRLAVSHDGARLFTGAWQQLQGAREHVTFHAVDLAGGAVARLGVIKAGRSQCMDAVVTPDGRRGVAAFGSRVAVCDLPAGKARWAQHAASEVHAVPGDPRRVIVHIEGRDHWLDLDDLALGEALPAAVRVVAAGGRLAGCAVWTDDGAADPGVIDLGANTVRRFAVDGLARGFDAVVSDDGAALWVFWSAHVAYGHRYAVIDLADGALVAAGPCRESFGHRRPVAPNGREAFLFAPGGLYRLDAASGDVARVPVPVPPDAWPAAVVAAHGRSAYAALDDRLWTFELPARGDPPTAG